MAEESRPWPGTAVGDAGPYSDDDWDDIWEILYGSGLAPYNDRGVIRNWANELEVTADPPNAVDVDTGAALVHGKFYNHTAPVINLNIPNSSGPGNWREDLICLQSDWAAQTIRIYRHANPGENVGYPAPTQNDGVTWEIPLWAVQVDDVGAITLIQDLREYISDLMQPKQLQIRPTPIAGATFSQLTFHSGVLLDAINEYASFEVLIPSDFIAFVGDARLYLIPDGAGGNIDWRCNMAAATCDEIASTHNGFVVGAGVAVVNLTVECIDITPIAGPTAGDIMSFRFYLTNMGGIPRVEVHMLEILYR